MRIVSLIKFAIYLLLAFLFLSGDLGISPFYAGIMGVLFLSLAIRQFLLFLIDITAPHGRMPKREKFLRKSISYFFTAILFGFEGYIFWRDIRMLSHFISVKFVDLIYLSFFAIAAISLLASFVYFIRAIIKK